jgi:type I restriction enzyme M protein
MRPLQNVPFCLRQSTLADQAQILSLEMRNPDGDYEDVKGFCNSASIERVKELDYVLTPGRYVGLPDNEDYFDFNERFAKLKAEFGEQLTEEARLNKLILENLGKIEVKNG